MPARAMRADGSTPGRLAASGLLARLLDVAVIVLGALAAARLHFPASDISMGDEAIVMFSVALSLVLFPAFGVYHSWRGRPLPALAGRITLAWLAAQMLAIILVFSLHRAGAVSRLWLAEWTVLAAGMLVASRLCANLLLRRLRHAGLNLRSVAVVGQGAHCRQLIRRMHDTPASGFRAAAVLDLGLDPGPGSDDRAAPSFAEFDAFCAHVQAAGIPEVWLALALSDEAMILRFVERFGGQLVNVRLIPDVRSIALFDGAMIDLLGAPAINLVAASLPYHAVVQKEIFDRLFAACALMLLLPLMGVIALAIKLSSPGPVLFKQWRKGADGQAFRILKFRTMRVHEETPGVLTQASRGDARITSLGRYLRRTSLDELPQFLNVLRGEMSVVGPRPHAIEHDLLYQDVVAGYIHRYRIKPGITGWAQVNGHRGQTDRLEKMQQRVEHDLYYLRNWSFTLDLRILVATLVKGFSDKNAH